MLHGRSRCCHCLIPYLLLPILVWCRKHYLGEDLKPELNVYLVSVIRVIFCCALFLPTLVTLVAPVWVYCFMAIGGSIFSGNIIHHVTVLSYQGWAIPIHSTATSHFILPISICIENGIVALPRLDLIALWESFA